MNPAVSELERGSGLTLWRQIEQQLEQELAVGRWPPGAQLPTEMELADRFQVSRLTLRRAMASLADRGLIRIEQGRGSFVHEHLIDYTLGKRTRFSEIISGQRREPAGRLLGTATIGATGAVARELALRAGTEVLRVRRLGIVDGRPLSYADHYFPARRFAGLAEQLQRDGSISRGLAALGVTDYTRKVTRVTARLPDRQEASQLELPATRPVLVTESVNVDAQARPIEYGVARFAADRVQLVIAP